MLSKYNVGIPYVISLKNGATIVGNFEDIPVDTTGKYLLEQMVVPFITHMYNVTKDMVVYKRVALTWSLVIKVELFDSKKHKLTQITEDTEQVDTKEQQEVTNKKEEQKIVQLTEDEAAFMKDDRFDRFMEEIKKAKTIPSYDEPDKNKQDFENNTTWGENIEVYTDEEGYVASKVVYTAPEGLKEEFSSWCENLNEDDLDQVDLDDFDDTLDDYVENTEVVQYALEKEESQKVQAIPQEKKHFIRDMENFEQPQAMQNLIHLYNIGEINKYKDSLYMGYLVKEAPLVSEFCTMVNESDIGHVKGYVVRLLSVEGQSGLHKLSGYAYILARGLNTLEIRHKKNDTCSRKIIRFYGMLNFSSIDERVVQIFGVYGSLKVCYNPKTLGLISDKHDMDMNYIDLSSFMISREINKIQENYIIAGLVQEQSVVGVDFPNAFNVVDGNKPYLISTSRPFTSSMKGFNYSYLGGANSAGNAWLKLGVRNKYPELVNKIQNVNAIGEVCYSSFCVIDARELGKEQEIEFYKMMLELSDINFDWNDRKLVKHKRKKVVFSGDVSEKTVEEYWANHPEMVKDYNNSRLMYIYFLGFPVTENVHGLKVSKVN